MESASKSNTEFEYRYRDASNYKWLDTVVISGFLTMDDLKKYLIDGEFFVPELIGMKNLVPETRNDDDHDWHEIVALTPTAAPANFTSSEEVLKRFRAQHRAGWPCYPQGWRHG